MNSQATEPKEEGAEYQSEEGLESFPRFRTRITGGHRTAAVCQPAPNVDRPNLIFLIHNE